MKPKSTRKKGSKDYWEEWVLNKAKAIYKKNGIAASQEYLLKFVDPNNKNSCINRYLYEIRDEFKKIV